MAWRRYKGKKKILVLPYIKSIRKSSRNVVVHCDAIIPLFPASANPDHPVCLFILFGVTLPFVQCPRFSFVSNECVVGLSQSVPRPPFFEFSTLFFFCLPWFFDSLLLSTLFTESFVLPAMCVVPLNLAHPSQAASQFRAVIFVVFLTKTGAKTCEARPFV